MIVVDTSALAAILLIEPEADAFDRIIRSSPCLISAASVVELAILPPLRRRSLLQIEGWLDDLGIEIVPTTAAQLVFVIEGRDRFGRGRAAPPAVLNFGDLFAYALARERNLPLLYKGEDFAATDVRAALA